MEVRNRQQNLGFGANALTVAVKQSDHKGAEAVENLTEQLIENLVRKYARGRLTTPLTLKLECQPYNSLKPGEGFQSGDLHVFEGLPEKMQIIFKKALKIFAPNTKVTEVESGDPGYVRDCFHTLV